MVFLLLSVCCSVAVSVLLKVARRRSWEVALLVALNYPTAAFTLWLVAQPPLPDAAVWRSGWWLFAALGVLLPSVFIVMGRAVQAAGIVRADAAQRLALVIPLVSAFVLFREQLSPWSLVGIGLVFAALFCLLSYGEAKESLRASWLLVGVWAGYGVIDVLLKALSQQAKVTSLLLVTFVLAGVLMAGYVCWRRVRVSAAACAAGVLLGVLNVGNIVFYIKAHTAMKENPSVVFAGMNVGVIALGTLVGAGFFGERLLFRHVAGLVLALAAIGCLTWARLSAGAA
ncbi:DMT family transporter [Cardiobacterium valvarum]|uniref:EamA-like transporter family n=1 Tax=Cardiobacterium valvarum TaxID=194702 RepID=A0A381ED08_9GAMM|nr:DMT family transporter [Cardiobacterium valvarum]SUX24763.1 EamA-like transporter family [Cardiobacterium valvarum]